MIVVDASIAAKWYLNELGSKEAAALLTSASVLIAPALVRIEVNGAILRRYREGLLSLERAREACDCGTQTLQPVRSGLCPTESLSFPLGQLPSRFGTPFRTASTWVRRSKPAPPAS